MIYGARRRSARLGLAVLVLGINLVACGGEQAQNDTLGPPEWIRELDPTIDRPTWVGLHHMQKGLLTDGDLVFDEYAGAVQRTVDCAMSKGHDVTVTQLSPDGNRLSWRPIGTPTLDFYSALLFCEDQHSRYILYLWTRVQPPSAEEFRRAQERVETCMAEAGINMPAMNTPAWSEWLGEGGLGEGGNRITRCVQLGGIMSGIGSDALRRGSDSPSAKD